MVQQASISYPKSEAKKETKKKGRAQEIDQYIGERLKHLRKKNRLTQEDLAEKLGISFQQIQKYENGKNRISFGRIVELSNYLNVPLEGFIKGFEEACGLSDSAQQAVLDGYDDNNIIPQKETDELLRVYYSLEDPKLRKNLLQFVKTMAENLKES